MIFKFCKLLPFFLIFTLAGYAQCTEALNNARDKYEAGHLHEIPAILKKCLEGGFSKSEKVEAYRLLTITYLYIDDPVGAENSFMELLHEEPEYRVTQLDPIELDHLSKQFITNPIITFRPIKLGLGISEVQVIHNNGTDNTAQTQEYYSYNEGIKVGVGGDLNFMKFLSLSIDIEYGQSVYTYNNIINYTYKVDGGDPQIAKLSHHMFHVPFYLKFTYPTKKLYPYIYAGYGLDINFSTNASASIEDVTPTSYDENGSVLTKEVVPITDDLTITPMREFFTQSLVGGIGLNYRINYKYISLDFRYRAGLKNFLNENNQFDFESNEYINKYTFLYQIVEDDFRLDDIVATLGFVWPIYNPRKKKANPVKFAIGNIFNKNK